jgi:hypothetical protein
MAHLCPNVATSSVRKKVFARILHMENAKLTAAAQSSRLLSHLLSDEQHSETVETFSENMTIEEWASHVTTIRNTVGAMNSEDAFSMRRAEFLYKLCSYVTLMMLLVRMELGLVILQSADHDACQAFGDHPILILLVPGLLCGFAFVTTLVTGVAHAKLLFETFASEECLLAHSDLRL